MFINKGITQEYFKTESCFEMFSDHMPVVVILLTNIKIINKPSTLHNLKTNWNKLRALINEKVILNLLLKTPDDVDNAIQYLNILLQESSYAATSELVLSEETKLLIGKY